MWSSFKTSDISRLIRFRSVYPFLHFTGTLGAFHSSGSHFFQGRVLSVQSGTHSNMVCPSSHGGMASCTMNERLWRRRFYWENLSCEIWAEDAKDSCQFQCEKHWRTRESFKLRKGSRKVERGTGLSDQWIRTSWNRCIFQSTQTCFGLHILQTTSLPCRSSWDKSPPRHCSPFTNPLSCSNPSSGTENTEMPVLVLALFQDLYELCPDPRLKRLQAVPITLPVPSCFICYVYNIIWIVWVSQYLYKLQYVVITYSCINIYIICTRYGICFIFETNPSQTHHSAVQVHFSHLRLQKSTKAPHDAPGQDASVGILPSTNPYILSSLVNVVVLSMF